MNAAAYRGEALNDAALDTVHGGGLGEVLEGIGDKVADGFVTGGRIGIYGGPVFAFGGMMAGAAYGAINGVKSALADGIRSLFG